jgi:hypothetical protein
MHRNGNSGILERENNGREYEERVEGIRKMEREGSGKKPTKIARSRLHCRKNKVDTRHPRKPVGSPGSVGRLVAPTRMSAGVFFVSCRDKNRWGVAVEAGLSSGFSIHRS